MIKKTKQRQFKVGDKVWLRNKSRKNKFSAIWEGPYEVIEIRGAANVVIVIKGKKKTFHCDLLKPFNEQHTNANDSEKNVDNQVLAVNSLGGSLNNLDDRKILKEHWQIKKLPIRGTFNKSNQNSEKNRYTDVPCFDHSRVRLKNRENDYIHANFLGKCSSGVEIIATQGPMTNTISDFWEMVWEQNCSTIIMLTQEVENYKEKCAKYWSRDIGRSLVFRNFQVTTKHIEAKKHFTLSKIELLNRVDNNIRTVLHWQFTSWPDNGIPDSEELLEFWKKALKNNDTLTQMKSCPIVVHCSAGVGRTATMIAIDRGLKYVAEKKKLNIFEIVQRLRSKRAFAISCLQQYMFVYKTLCEEQRRKNW